MREPSSGTAAAQQRRSSGAAAAQQRRSSGALLCGRNDGALKAAPAAARCERAATWRERAATWRERAATWRERAATWRGSTRRVAALAITDGRTQRALELPIALRLLLQVDGLRCEAAPSSGLSGYIGHISYSEWAPSSGLSGYSGYSGPHLAVVRHAQALHLARARGERLALSLHESL